MNGAIAEPLANTINPPNATIMIRIGNSQNFLRTRMNLQSSTTSPIETPSELIRQRVGLRARWRAMDPVALCRRVKPERQRTPADRTHHPADRRDRHEEHQTQNDRHHDGMQEQAEAIPQDVERVEGLRPNPPQPRAPP